MPGADPLIGPITVVPYYKRHETPVESFEFYAPVLDWEWEPHDTAATRRPVSIAKGSMEPCPVHIYTYCAQSQQGGQTWFAFSHYDQYWLAMQMVKADKIGWMTALKILSKTPWREIQRLIDDGDREGFMELPKIGPKTGEALVKVLFNPEIAQPVKEKPTKLQINEDAVGALKALGWPALQAKKIVSDVQEGNPDLPTDELVRKCLRSTAK